MSTPFFLSFPSSGGGGNGEIGRLDFPANETTTKCKGKLKLKKKNKKQESISVCRERMRVNGSFDGIDDDLLATLADMPQE
jgi:hypothetical protein